jgi:hypothetical protein
MATFERKIGFTNDDVIPITPDDHDAILQFHDGAREQERGILEYALSRSPPAHRGARVLDLPLKQPREIDLDDDQLMREILR